MRKLIGEIFGRHGSEDAQREYLLSKGMKVGKNTNIYSWSGIDAGKPWLIEIGDDVTISSNVTILTHDASPCKVGCGTKLGRVRIGNNVFIGTRSIVLCNVSLGDNVIVGAGSIVTRDLPSDGVYAGSPVRRICSFDEYRKKYEKLREERPAFDKIKPWNEWGNATDEEKKLMYDGLEDGVGFF